MAQCDWSSDVCSSDLAGLGSVTPALKITERPVAVPPAGIGVVLSPWNWPRAVGAAGGTSIEVLKSGAVSAFPPNVVQPLARPVWSAVRACQWYPVLLVSPGTATNPFWPFATRPPI